MERLAPKSRVTPGLTHPTDRVEAGVMRQAGKQFWDGPWPWLAYLVFYPLPWLWRTPSITTLAWSALGIAVFLWLYFAAYRVNGARLVAMSAGMLAIGVALAPLGGGWTVLAVYAGAAIGHIRPRRLAPPLLGAICAVTALTGVAYGQPWLWWLQGVVLVVMTGGATVSREAFYDRTQALLSTQEEVRRLAGTAERERIARDLHDVVGRTLTLVALKADLAGKLVERDGPAARAELDTIAAAARAGLAEVRAALAGQSGGSLAHEAAASCAALETAGIAPRLTGDPATIPADAGAVLAMTLREAVTNVIRHAGATCCTIAVSAGEDGARLIVDDDGMGRSFREGNGLTGMRQRLVAAGGTLVLSDRSPGTRIEASVPI